MALYKRGISGGTNSISGTLDSKPTKFTNRTAAPASEANIRRIYLDGALGCQQKKIAPSEEYVKAFPSMVHSTPQAKDDSVSQHN